MTLPIDLADLPEPLAEIVGEADEEELWGDAIDPIEDWLDETGQRPPAVLVALAYVLYRDALDIMVDEVEERGTRALALLDEAKLTKQTAKLRREITRSVSRDRAYTKEREERVAATRERPLEELTREELREVAYNHAKTPAGAAMAARAWVLASNMATTDYDKHDCIGRAALEFAEAGDWAEAMPRLEAIVKAPTDYEGWIADYAWHELLDKAIADGDTAAFEARWSGALAMKRADYFPFSQPKQAEYLEYAVEQKLVAIARHIVGIVMEHRSPRERKPLQALLDRANAL